MDVELRYDPFETAERKALANMVADFTRREIAPNLDAWETAKELPRSLHEAAGEAGLLGIGYPEDLGGAGGDTVDQTVTTEQMFANGGSGGVGAGLFTHSIAIPHVIDAVRVRAEMKQPDVAEWLTDSVVRPVLAGEKIAALGVTEPDGGSDVARLRTTAVQDGESWVINGAKTFITSGARADIVVVAARTGGLGANGISLFAVETDLPGFNVVRRLDKMGWHCSDTAELAFVDLRVPERALLTPGPGDGFASLARHFALERIALATTAYSTAARCYDLSAEWARTRETFGAPLISRQAIRHMLVAMHERIELTRTYTRSVAVRHAAGESVLLEAVTAKNSAVEACDFVVDKAVQIHGGVGYMTGTEVERHYRDSRILGIGGGATEVMTDLAAKLLGL